jgi:hypothetical protein
LDYWKLFHRPDADSDGWHSFVLRHYDGRFRKYSYWGGWNGERVARNTDMGRLNRRFPEIMQWVERSCRRKWNVI